MRNGIIAAALLSSILLLDTAGVAQAGDTECIGALTGVFDSIVVPENQTCVLSNSTVRGNVTALQNSGLSSFNNAIGGNVQGKEAQFIQLHGDTIDGNVQADDLDVRNTAVVWLSVNGARIRGSVQADGSGEVSEVSVSGSEIGGTVQIRDVLNFAGGGNIIAGNLDVERVIQETQVAANHVGGNLRVREAGSVPDPNFRTVVVVCANTVDGNATVEENTGFIVVGSDPTNPLLCLPNSVASKLRVRDNVIPSGDELRVRHNAVSNELDVSDNRGQGVKTVQANTVGDRIRCRDNDQPFIGGPNVAPRREGQCF